MHSFNIKTSDCENRTTLLLLGSPTRMGIIESLL